MRFLEDAKPAAAKVCYLVSKPTHWCYISMRMDAGNTFFWLPSAAAHLLKSEFLITTFNTQIAKQELQIPLLSSTITETDFGLRGFRRRMTLQDSAHLSFDGVSFTMDHCVRSHYAVRTWVCLHHLELHSTHPSTHQKDVTCKTPDFSSLLKWTSAKYRPLYYQPQDEEARYTGRRCWHLLHCSLHIELHSCIYCIFLSTLQTHKFHPVTNSKQNQQTIENSA